MLKALAMLPATPTSASPIFRAPCRLYQAIKNGSKAGSAVRDLGCSIPEFKRHIESLWLPGMSWENWGRSGWSLDHIKPLSAFDLSDRQQFLEACHYSNIRPLWHIDNMRKGAKERRPSVAARRKDA
jgi:hypothetical protein